MARSMHGRRPNKTWVVPLGLAVLAAAPGCASLPPVQAPAVPALLTRPAPGEPGYYHARRGREFRRQVLHTYGPPRGQSPAQLWYVGPRPDSLLQGADGWMTLLWFDTTDMLRRQEYLVRAAAATTRVRVEYWIAGQVADRDRAADFDTVFKEACSALADRNLNYEVTSRGPHAFVLVRLPSGPSAGSQPQAGPGAAAAAAGEALVDWTYERSELTERVAMEIDLERGRDQPLIDLLDAKIAERMEAIEAACAPEANP